MVLHTYTARVVHDATVIVRLVSRVNLRFWILVKVAIITGLDILVLDPYKQIPVIPLMLVYQTQHVTNFVCSSAKLKVNGLVVPAINNWAALNTTFGGCLNPLDFLHPQTTYWMLA